MTTPAPSIGGLARNRPLVLGLAVTETVSWGVLFYALPVLLVPMERDLGWSRSLLVGGYTVAIVLSGLAAPAVGRWLDTSSPRALMTVGSAAGTALVIGWSQVTSPVAYYLVWIGIGLVKAAVLYEVAFAVLAKRCAPDHQRALLAVTLTAGLASFVFQPLTSALASAYGWRGALMLLAMIVGAVTVPIHWAVLPARPDRPPSGPTRTQQRVRATRLVDRRFWSLTAAFTAATMTSFATSVLLIAYLIDQGWGAAGAALAGGMLGAMQLPGRLAFGPLARRVPRHVLAGTLFSLPGLGVAVLLISDGGWPVWAAIILLGVGQGSVTLLRAVLLVDLYGTARIGTLGGMVATPVTVGRAVAPLAAVLIVGRTGGYTIAFLLLIVLSVLAVVMAVRTLPGADATRQPPLNPSARAVS